MDSHWEISWESYRNSSKSWASLNCASNLPTTPIQNPAWKSSATTKVKEIYFQCLNTCNYQFSCTWNLIPIFNIVMIHIHCTFRRIRIIIINLEYFSPDSLRILNGKIILFCSLYLNYLYTQGPFIQHGHNMNFLI